MYHCLIGCGNPGLAWYESHAFIIYKHKPNYHVMKPILIALMLICNVASYSQQEYKKVPKDFCKIDHTCRLKTREDKFEKTTDYEIPNFETVLDKSRRLSYSLKKSSKDSVDVLTIMVLYCDYVSECRSPDSYVSFELADGEILKIPNAISTIDCGTSFIIIDIKNYIDIIIERPIKSIRVNLSLNHDYEITDKGREKLINNLKCIKAAGI